VAGVTVALIGIPQSLAYADLAGMPPVAGLYAGAIPPLVAAFFASSPYLQTGPVAVTALLTFGALSTHATPGSPDYAALGLGLALIVGAVRIALGLLRAGWLAYLMSHPMLVGFVPAAALLIVAAQTPKAFGVQESAPYDNEVLRAAWAAGHPQLWNSAALVAAALTVAVVLAGRRLHVLFPGVLLCAVVATVVSAAGAYDGPTVGELPAGFPSLTVDDLPWGQLPSLLLSGAVIALVGFSESASIGRRFAAQDRTRWSAEREFVSQGVANVAAACTGGMPCGGSFSRSSLARASGARTRLAGGITGLTVLAFLPFAGIIEPLPLAVLGAVVITAVLGLLRFRPLVALWRLSVPQALVAWTTFLATLALAPRIDLAVLAGVGMSIAVFLSRALQLDVDVEYAANRLVIVPRGSLWFGTAQRLDAILLDAMAAYPAATHLEIDLARLGRIDTTGALVLRSLLDHVRQAGLDAKLCNIPPQSQALTGRILAADDRDL
jgi:sulfate permease, SulP family